MRHIYVYVCGCISGDVGAQGGGVSKAAEQKHACDTPACPHFLGWQHELPVERCAQGFVHDQRGLHTATDTVIRGTYTSRAADKREGDILWIDQGSIG